MDVFIIVKPAVKIDALACVSVAPLLCSSTEPTKRVIRSEGKTSAALFTRTRMHGTQTATRRAHEHTSSASNRRNGPSECVNSLHLSSFAASRSVYFHSVPRLTRSEPAERETESMEKNVLPQIVVVARRKSKNNFVSFASTPQRINGK